MRSQGIFKMESFGREAPIQLFWMACDPGWNSAES